MIVELAVAVEGFAVVAGLVVEVVAVVVVAVGTECSTHSHVLAVP